MRPARRPILALLLAAGCGLATAQYRVVGPDGRITYTDRPTTGEPGSKVSAVRNPVAAAPVNPLASLPPALRPAAARHPVTLYTSADCAPCDRARALLRQRGIPHAEFSIGNDADAQALERLSGGRTVPTLAVGQQWQRGLLDSEWQATLDLAGYPKESALPRGWNFAAATPLTPRAAAEPPPAQALAPAARPVPEPPPPAPAATDGPRIRF